MAPQKRFPWRRLVQILFALITVVIGLQFIRFVSFYNQPLGNIYPHRPAGVEAFLPISALVALKAWLATGVFDTIHPAGLVIFLAAIGISFVLKRAFCSWICPIGTLSEGLSLLGRKLFKKNWILPSWLDYSLRSLKYILLIFFGVFIFEGMSGQDALAFLQTPYNMAADVKMLQFFLSLSIVGITVFILLILVSVFVQNFWCRYLCPYGALLGLLSFLSPFKIKRNTESCIHCSQCSKACPNHISVDQLTVVRSVECNGCMNCVEACPVKDTLDFKFEIKSKKPQAKLSPLVLGIIIIVAWLSIVAFAKITGHWENAITPDMYRFLIPMSV